MENSLKSRPKADFFKTINEIDKLLDILRRRREREKKETERIQTTIPGMQKGTSQQSLKPLKGK